MNCFTCKKNFFYLLFSSILLLFLYACESDTDFEKNLDVNTQHWNYNDTLAFEFNISDSDARYNLLLNIRHRDVFEWQNLYVKMVVLDPTNQTQIREINIPLCEDDGAWIGNCTGDLCFLRVFLAEHRKIFPIKGSYKILIFQDMRTDDLKNVLAVGLRIEKSIHKKK